MRIAIYGGSFNPPHRGHVEAARSVQAALKPDKLLIIPTNIPPHKQMEADSPKPSERLAFCRLRSPAGLTETAQRRYRAYLEGHRLEALRYALQTKDAESLRLALTLPGLAEPELAAALDQARAAGNTEAAAVLLEERHRRFPGKKKAWDL